VLAFAYALDPTRSNFVWWHFVLRDVTLGFLVGIAVGWVCAKPKPTEPSLYGIGVAFATYALAHALQGNGLIAVYVCAITLGIRRPQIREAFEHDADDIIEIVKLGIFVVFGSLLTIHGLFTDGVAAVAIAVFTLVVARPVAVLVALVGTRTDLPTRLFMGWFGPKGVATMTFSLLVLSGGIASGTRIFNIAALTVFVSILAHGLTDTPGANAIARHAERVAA
jgi:NhaP-type Na+/H+ and K+/H+ antiporter